MFIILFTQNILVEGLLCDRPRGRECVSEHMSGRKVALCVRATGGSWGGTFAPGLGRASGQGWGSWGQLLPCLVAVLGTLAGGCWGYF